VILDALFDEHATTEGVTVRVVTNFLEDQSAPSQSRWFWSYHIRIENHRDDPVQLLSRHWKITDGHGGVNHVDGDGVVGEQPLLKPDASPMTMYRAAR
jgi:ApaG protein